MTIRDIQLLEAVTQLHNIARLIETDVGKGTLSEQVRDAADTLMKVIKVQEWVK